MALTPAGIELRDALYLLEESDGLADARLNLRVHRLEDWHAAPLGADTLMLLVAGRSGRARVDAARMLMEDVDGGREYADRLAKCWDPKVRILAAPYADPHLFLDETDPDVVGASSKADSPTTCAANGGLRRTSRSGSVSRPGRSSQTASRPTACSPR